jgi:hypothetical protein
MPLEWCSNVSCWLTTDSPAMSPVRLHLPQQPTFAGRCPLSCRFRPLCPHPMSPSALMMSAKLIRCQSRCHRAVPGKEPRREGHLLGALRLTSSYDAVFWCRWCISRYFSCLYVWVPVTCPYRSVRTVSLKYGNNPVGSGHYWVRGGW